MGCFRLGKCCFVVPLETGALFIGFLNMLMIVLSMAVCVISMFAVEAYEGRGKRKNPGVSLMDFKVNPRNFTRMNENMRTLMKSTLPIGLAVCIVYAAMTSVYIVGLRKKKPIALRFYWISTLFLIFTYTLMDFFVLIVNENVELHWALIVLGIELYFVIVIRSTELEMSKSEESLPLRGMSISECSGYNKDTVTSQPDYMSVKTEAQIH